MNTTKGTLRFKLMYLMIGIIPMTLLGIILGIVAVNTGTNQLRNGIKGELTAASTGVNEYFAYDVISNGTVDYDEYSDHEYVEGLQSQGIELTLFEGDTRLLTSLKNSDGSYNEGTQASPEIYATVKSGQSYYAEGVEINGTKYSVYYEPVYGDGGTFWGMAFAGKTEASIKEETTTLVLKIVILIIAFIIIMSIVTFILAGKLEKSLSSIVSGLGKIEKGRIGIRIEPSSIVTEFRQLEITADSLAQKLSEVIGNTKGTAGNLGDSVLEVDRLISDTSEGTNQISLVVNEMATTAQSMAENVQEANSAIIEMGNSIDVISESASASAEDAKNMLILNEETAHAMEGVSRANAESSEVIGTIDEYIQQCNEAVAQIKETASVIGSIAGQTNLLALNASIEAARAGDVGRGFSVVAENIKDLAEKSKISATEIELSVDVVVEKVARCVEASSNATNVMRTQSEYVDAAREKVIALSTSVQTVSSSINQIGNEAVSLNQWKDTVLNNITDLSAISEENAASSQEATASIVSIAQNVEGTKLKSNGMGTLAHELMDRVQYFD